MVKFKKGGNTISYSKKCYIRKYGDHEESSDMITKKIKVSNKKEDPYQNNYNIIDNHIVVKYLFDFLRKYWNEMLYEKRDGDWKYSNHK